MAQRYTDPTSREWMAAGACPECGRDSAAHGNDPRFWMPVNASCNLMEHGVVERIQQYRRDQETPAAAT